MESGRPGWIIARGNLCEDLAVALSSSDPVTVALACGSVEREGRGESLTSGHLWSALSLVLWTPSLKQKCSSGWSFFQNACMSEAHSALPSPSPGPRQLSLGKQSFSIPGGGGGWGGVMGQGEAFLA